MDSQNSLDERKVVNEKWERQHIKLSLKSFDGRLAVDIRKWFTADDGVNHPTRKGIMLEISDWHGVFETFNQMIKDNNINVTHEGKSEKS